MTGRGAVHPSTETASPARADGDDRMLVSGDDHATPAALAWSWNPWRERPARAAGAVVGAIAAFVVARLALAPPALAAALAAAVAGALSPLLVPQRCRVDDSGVQVRGAFGWERRAWGEVRRAVRQAGGILFSPYAHPRRRDAYRALFVPVPAASDAALEPALRAHLARHGL